MIVAITGGSGFIGSKLVQRHSEMGDDVRVLTRSRALAVDVFSSDVKLFAGDLLQGAVDLKSFVDGVDVLYHCAGEINNPALMFSLHVEGTKRLIAAASGQVGRWIQLSSVGAYGPCHQGEVTEETPLAPVGPYETSKTHSDELVAKAGNAGAFSCSILRPSNVYGPTMSNQSLFQLIAMIQRGWFCFIGRPGAMANYIHVDNVVEALLACGENSVASPTVYNLSDHCPLERFVAIIAECLAKSPPRKRLPELPVRLLAKTFGELSGVPLTESRVNALTNRSVYPITRIQRELGYRHAISIEAGVCQLVEAWQQSQVGNVGAR